MVINKYWTNKGYSSGFGDLINQISYDYINADEYTIINWHLQPRTHRQLKRILNFFKPIGINIPNKPATIIFKIIDIDIIKDNIGS